MTYDAILPRADRDTDKAGSSTGLPRSFPRAPPRRCNRDNPEKIPGQADAAWQEVTEEEFLRRTEWACYWKKGTVLGALRDAGQLSTPWADFRLAPGGAT
jgi:hypothetical protein